MLACQQRLFVHHPSARRIDDESTWLAFAQERFVAEVEGGAKPLEAPLEAPLSPPIEGGRIGGL